MQTSYFQTDYVDIFWDEEIAAVVSIWIGYSGGGVGKVQTGYGKVKELLIEHEAKKILSDIRELLVVDQADQEWIAQTGTGEMVEAGLRHIAVVMPQSILGKSSVKRTMARVSGMDFEIGNFSDMDKAKTWLKSK